jgi:NitT/TauT family transport system substrate-binding protein
MMKKAFLFVSIFMLLTFITGCQSKSSSGEADTKKDGKETELTIAFSTWVGYAPMYIAEEKGFFKKNGINVKLTRMESSSDRLSALAAKRVTGIGGTVDSHVVASSRGVPLVQVLVTDDSKGGDGIVANKDIKTFADLKGKKIAVQTDGGASFFWFNYLLKKEGMTMDDFEIQSMSSGDAGAAFVAKKVDAAITWEPWLTSAKNTDFGHVLLSSEKTPGIITGSFALHKDFLKEHPEAVKAFNKSWFEAVDYYKEHKEESIAIMAKAMGQTTDEFKEALAGAGFYDKEGNMKYFGTKEAPGPLYDLTKMGADLWEEQKLIDKKPNIDNLLDYSFIQ